MDEDYRLRIAEAEIKTNIIWKMEIIWVALKKLLKLN